ncbi:hypothetical protein FH972_007193 [Carpinus fangiana]|uniref:Uncharacterized protein n=1 Tax=Carpinus fangiana TaxID=176857 RepID=A0A5N6QVM4_9ROSI|nr:hypothetical protein FH972_007193 [Carpinus fangiana]
MYKSLTEESANTYHGAAPLFFSCSHDIFFCLYNETATSLYSINIEADRPHKVYPESLLIPFWKGKLPANGFLAAALGSHIYCIGRGTSPTQGIRDVYKLRVTPHIAKEWVTGPYFSSDISKILHDSFGYWRIIVAYRVPNVPNEPNEGYYDIFYAYNLHHKHWKKLKPSKRELDPMFFEEQEYPHVCVNNTLYWIKPGMAVKDDLLFIAYDLDLDMWLEGCLNGFGRFFFQDYSMWGSESSYRPEFIHLEKQRFSLLQRSEDYGYLRYLLIEISLMPNDMTLGISVLWDHIFEMEPETLKWWRLSSCFVMPNKEVRFFDKRK